MSHSLYVHIPLCVKKCAYCDFFSDPSFLGRENAILQALQREIAERANRNRVTEWDTVYIGGGTPSILKPQSIIDLAEAIRRAAPIVCNAEWTIEANPEDVTEPWLNACARGGVNRLSMGLQSMSDAELQAVGRRGSRAANLEALETVSRVWTGQLSVDLMSGLPGQTAETLRQSVETTMEYRPQHVSLYALTLEEGTPLERSARAGMLADLPEGDDADELWIQGRDMLLEAGFNQYEVSNFCRPGFESRHNLVYWNLGDWIGAGPSASGTIREGREARRSTGAETIAEWLPDPTGSAHEEILSRDECERESVMMGMRLLEGLDRKRFELRFGRDILERMPTTCDRWKSRNLLTVTPARIALNEAGLLTLNAFLRDCMEEMG